MQTTEIEDHALRARANKAQRMIPKGYSLSAQDVGWISGLAKRLGVSDSQVLRGVLAQARKIELKEVKNA